MPSQFTPTQEQQDALDIFATGQSFAIEAGAGTGKTSTLVLLAESAPDRVGRYLAFNKGLVTDATEKVPSNVTASTMHSLAFRAVGRQFSKRLNSGRMRSDEIARRLRIDPIEVTVPNVGRKRLAAGFLAGHVMRAVTRFCQTADPEPTAKHVNYIDGIDLPLPDGRRTYDNNRVVADALVPYVQAAWRDWNDPDGQLPYKHDGYLKRFQLSDPVIDCDFILYDEVQDADPVQADIILQQMRRGTQVVIVGDSCQEIYGWRGAVNAFSMFDMDETTYLTQSWRFGDAIADAANDVLDAINGAELRLRGTPSIESSVGIIDTPRAVLCRTNASSVREVLGYLGDGMRPHLVGGGREVVSFARGAQALMDGRKADHPDLGCFDSWSEVRDYVDQDAQGDELRLLVRLVDEFGPQKIIGALGERMPSEAQADVIVSTAHRAKGREWDTVRLAGDFTVKSTSDDSERRLLYVAVTRARLVLDVTLVGFFAEDDEREETLDDVLAALVEEEEMVADAVLDGTIRPEPKACPSCGRTDVFTDDGYLMLTDDHLCPPVAKAAR